MSPAIVPCEDPIPEEFCAYTLDKIFSCDPHVHIRDTQYDDTINIDDEKLVQLRVFLNEWNDPYTWSAKVCNILTDNAFLYEPSSVLEVFRKLMINYPCHVCHKDILRALLTVTKDNYLDELNEDFVKQVLSNIFLNIDILSTEVVWLCADIFLKLKPDKITQKKILEWNLVHTFLPMIVRYGPEFKIYQHFNMNLRKVLISALMVFKDITAVYRYTCGFEPVLHTSTRIISALAKAFEADADLVIAIVRNIIHQFTHRHIKNHTKRMKRSCVWHFYCDFTEELYKEKTSNHCSFDAVKYVETISALNQFLFETFPDLDPGQKSNYSDHNLKSMLELAPELDCFPTLDWYDIIIKGVLDAVDDVYLVDDSFDFFYLKTLEILEQMEKHGGGKLDHVQTKTGIFQFRNIEHEFKYKYKSTPEVTRLKKVGYEEKNSEWISKILETILMFFRKNVVNKFDLRFLQALISVAYCHIKFYCGNYLIELLRLILDQKLSSILAILDTGIAKAIVDVINRFHNSCTVCAKGFDVMKQLLHLLLPTADDRFKLKQHCTIQQAVSITYLLHTKRSLFPIMYPKGFNKLTEQLRNGEDVESLFMVSQTLNAIVPSVLHTSDLQSIPCKNHLNDPVENMVDTIVFVLDDGKEIRSSTALLVKYSDYFSSLLDGRFHEAKTEEIHIRDVTEFQFHFVVNFIHFEASEQKLKFEMELQEHLDMIVLCDRLSLPRLCQHLIDSLRSCMTADALPDVYELGTVYGIQYLRRMCLDHALAGNTKAAMKMKLLQILFENTPDRDLLAKDVTKWITLQCDYD